MARLNARNLGPFVQGINTVRAESELSKSELRDAVNVVLTDAGAARLRPGYAKVYTGSGVHSLWNRYFVDSEGLKRLNDDYTATLLTTLTSVTAPMSYAPVNQQVAYTNGVETGLIAGDQVKPLGVPTPQGCVLSTTSGVLPAGTYLVSLSFVDAEGQESAGSPVQRITLGEGQGLVLSSLPQLAAHSLRLYVSPPNSEQLRRVAEIPPGVTSWSLTSPFRGYEVPQTQNLQPLPAGSLIRYYRGRLWVAHGTQVSFSEPLRYGLYRPAQNYFLFSEPVTVLEPVLDGLYIVADKTYFYGGTSPQQMAPRIVSDHRAAAGSGMSVPGAWFKFDPPWPDECAYWFGDYGGVAAAPSGQIRPLMEGRAADRTFAKGASFVREYNGVRQVGTALSRPGSVSEFKALDSATATVRRNGVVIG